MNKLDNKGKAIEKSIYGNPGAEYRSIDLNIIPCIPKQLTEENKHLVDTECIADLTSPSALKKKFNESKAYLGRPSLGIVYNYDRLDLRQFTKKGEFLSPSEIKETEA